MRGNKDIFYCHLLPFVTTYCHKTAKNGKRLRVYTLHNSKKAVTAD